MNITDPKNFSKWLRRTRELNGLTQRRMSEITGLSKSQISRYEREAAFLDERAQKKVKMRYEEWNDWKPR